MAAGSIKDKNMPAISANIYCGLQKWVNRASISLRGRGSLRSRLNSDISSLSTYKRKVLEAMDPQPEQRILPAHGRSRSNPVEMPESVLNFEADVYQKIAKVPASRQTSSSNSALGRKPSSELSDDSSSQGSYKERNLSVLNQKLTQKFSKSESCLLDVDASFEKRSRSKSRTAPNCSRRRKSSDTDASLDSNSEIDINDNRKRRSSRSMNKTNKSDRSHSMETAKVDLMAANRSELSPKHLEQKSKEIHTRLDRWIEKSSVFQDSRQSSFESTSSSDEIFITDPIRLNETQHFRDLQTAIHELVSSCGQHSTKTSNGETIETKTQRKNFLKDSGPLLNQTISEFDSNCLPNEENGFLAEKNISKSIQLDDQKETKNQHEKINGMRNSPDIVDGIEVRGRDAICVGELNKVENHDSRNDIGPDSDSTRATNVPHDRDLHRHGGSTKNFVTVSKTDANSLNENAPGQELHSIVPHSELDHATSFSNEHRRTSPIPVNGKKLEGNMLNIPAKSPKSFHAPTPPRKRSGQKSSETKSKIPAFDDAGLTAFALECVQHAQKKKTSLDKRERDSKSDSDEEKRLLDHDFVYLPRNRQAKASTHSKTAYHDTSRGALSDDDTTLGKLRDLRDTTGSTDSLDGFVLFDEPIKDIDFDETKSHSSNENESTKGKDKTEYSKSGLKKFPSMPMFYVPKEFDSSGETKPVKSLGKSLWKRLKSIPRGTENNRTSQSSQKNKPTQNTLRGDPFYHGEKEDNEVVTKMRPKSNSVGSRKASRHQRRMSLDAERVLKPSINVTQPSEDRTSEDDQTTKQTSPLPNESHC